VCTISFTYAQLNAANQQLIPPAGCSGSFGTPASGDWSKFTWRAGIEYDISGGSMAYATATSGFKSGGLNANLPGTPETYAPETALSYELGIKSKLLHDTALLNVALFYTDYSNLQVTQFFSTPNAPSQQITSNAAKAGIYGVEIEGEWRLTPIDKVSGFLNYLHARYTDYHNAIDTLNNHVVPDLDGNRLINAPDSSVRAEYAHTFGIGSDSTLTPSAAVYWQSVMYLREVNSPIDRVGAYSKVDANLTYQRGSNWTARAFVHNATNKLTREAALQALGAYFSDYAPPRTYGVQVSYKY
jgi:iron complex outermembrane receptor protein